MRLRPSYGVVAAVAGAASIATVFVLAQASPGTAFGVTLGRAVRLLLGAGSEGSVAVVGPVAAVVLPLLVWAAILGGLWRLVRNPVRLWRIRHRGGHLVVAGDESLAPIVAGEGRSGNPAIVVTRGHPGRWLRLIHRTGSPHLEHDRLGGIGAYLRKARLVLIAGPEDEHNIATARSMLSAHDQLLGRPVALPVIVRVDDTRRHDETERSLLTGVDDQRLQIRLISLPALVGRALLRGNLIDRVERIGSPDRLLLVVGLTAISEQYMVDVLVSTHFADGRPVRIVVIDRAAEAQRTAFAARWPHGDRVGRPVFVEADVHDPGALSAGIGRIVEAAGVPATVLVDLGDEAASLAALEAVDAAMAGADRVSPAYAVHAGAAAVAVSPVAALPFGGADVAGHGELLMYEQQEAIARAIHDFYLEGRLDAGEALGSQPRINRWEALTEARRDDTRLLVDLYLLKLRDIGARIVPGRGAPLAFTGDEVREMVRAQHERWLASRALEGWAWGPTRDEQARHHPDMVPARDLPADAVDREREHIRIITRLLARSGYRAVRDLLVLVPAGGSGDVAAAAAALAHAYPDRALVFLGDPRDAGVRAQLHQLRALGHPVQLCVAHHLSVLTRGLAPDEAARLRDLLAHADRVIACAPGDSPEEILAERADHRLELSAVGGRRRHSERMAA